MTLKLTCNERLPKGRGPRSSQLGNLCTAQGAIEWPALTHKCRSHPDLLVARFLQFRSRAPDIVLREQTVRASSCTDCSPKASFAINAVVVLCCRGGAQRKSSCLVILLHLSLCCRSNEPLHMLCLRLARWSHNGSSARKLLRSYLDK